MKHISFIPSLCLLSFRQFSIYFSRFPEIRHLLSSQIWETLTSPFAKFRYRPTTSLPYLCPTCHRAYTSSRNSKNSLRTISL